MTQAKKKTTKAKATKKKASKKKPDGYVFGRPTIYKEEFCQKLVDHMEHGLSFEAFGAVANCSKETLYQWVKKYPHFSDAKSLGTVKSQLYWEMLGRDNIINRSDSESWGDGQGSSTSRSLNASAWIFNMKNRFKWRDKQPDEADVKITVNLADKVAKARARADKAKK